MTTAAQVRTAWADVWADSTVTAIAEKIYSYEVDAIAEESSAHAAKVVEDGDVNFIQWQVHKATEYGITGAAINSFIVSIQVVKEADFSGTNYNAIEDAFEIIDAAMLSNIGRKWSDTIDFMQPQEEAIEITPAELTGVPVWIGRYSYTGQVKTSIST